LGNQLIAWKARVPIATPSRVPVFGRKRPDWAPGVSPRRERGGAPPDPRFGSGRFVPVLIESPQRPSAPTALMANIPDRTETHTLCTNEGGARAVEALSEEA